MDAVLVAVKMAIAQIRAEQSREEIPETIASVCSFHPLI